MSDESLTETQPDECVMVPRYALAILTGTLIALSVPLPPANGNLLIPGIMSDALELSPKTQEYVGFLQSALAGTEVELKVRCEEQLDMDFDVEFVVRSSPCAKEFIVDRRRYAEVTNLLTFYYSQPDSVPPGYDYRSIFYYKSNSQRFSCKEREATEWTLFLDLAPHRPMQEHNVTVMADADVNVASGNAAESAAASSQQRSRRSAYPGLNGDSIDGGAKETLTSWHPVQSMPVDSIYILIVRMQAVNFPTGGFANTKHKVHAEVQWRGPFGFLSAIDYPLLNFYAFMSIFYMALAGTWLVLCLRRWRDLLRIQFWIGAVILVGLIEKTVFYAEYSKMNETGRSVEGLIELAEFTSCVKRTMAHVLIIIVSIGFGVVKPRLGSVKHQLVCVGAVYFGFCLLEGLTRVSRQSTEDMQQKQLVKLPLAMLEILICWWIFSSLVETMRALSMRRNVVKLALYRHFTNVLAMALLVAVLYMLWSLYIHMYEECLSDWKELWVDTAFWHFFFCSLLVVIMFLWRPSQNNQRYAFTPLLDNSEDEAEEDDDEDELYSRDGGTRSAVFEMVSKRSATANAVREKAGATEQSKIKDELDWINENIPVSFAEALLDADEEKEKRELELSKIQ